MNDRSSSSSATEGRILRLAIAVAGLGDTRWSQELGALIATPVPAGAHPEPSYLQLATAGIDTVEALATDGRWDDAAHQADRLTRAFSGQPDRPHAVAGESFDGLRAAAHARDREELDDFVTLLREIYGG